MRACRPARVRRLLRSRQPLVGRRRSLIFAGGASNLADRLLYDGYVVDFINIGIGSFRTGIFNIADVAITAGVVILLLGQRTAMQSISMSNGPGKGATHKKMRAGDPSGK